VVTLTDATGAKLRRETLEGECHGACTAKAKDEGAAHLDEIQQRIDKGESSQSETDYNFTECMFHGPDMGRIDTVGGRPIALIPMHGVGPHDVPRVTYTLALELCGALRVVGDFGEMYVHSWKLDQLSLRESPDHQQIIVEGASDFWRGVVFRLTLPACPGEAETEVLDTE
jgi:hypothetical protein